MPIQINEWSQGMSTNEVEILIRTFLEQNQNEAYSAAEIWDSLNLEGEFSELDYYLNRLTNAGLISVRFIKTTEGSMRYYLRH